MLILFHATAGTERVLITDTAVNLGVDVNLVFEGNIKKRSRETTLTVTNPDADRTILYQTLQALLL